MYGIGVNDAPYAVAPKVNGKAVMCPFYTTWRNMLGRCYNKSSQDKRPNYTQCSVVHDWLTFSNFKSWMEKQDWKGNHLDKDLLIQGNTTYSEDTCLFVQPLVNTFMTERAASRGDCPLGVSFHKSSGKYIAQVGPLGKGRMYLGLHDTMNGAERAYRKKKCELANELALMQRDVRVADALVSRYNYQSPNK